MHLNKRLPNSKFIETETRLSNKYNRITFFMSIVFDLQQFMHVNVTLVSHSNLVTSHTKIKKKLLGIFLGKSLNVSS